SRRGPSGGMRLQAPGSTLQLGEERSSRGAMQTSLAPEVLESCAEVLESVLSGLLSSSLPGAWSLEPLQTVKLVPHPHDDFSFGFTNLKPCRMSVFSQSNVAPFR